MTLPNPLFPLHEAASAEFQPYGPDLQIPQTFGLPQAEYSAIHKSAAILDRPERSFLQLTGKDRHPFLNNLLTNQTWDKETKQGLAPRTGVYAFLLNTKGRITTDVTVLELDAGRTLLELDARLLPTVETFLNKYIFTEQVKIQSLLGQLHLLSLHGPQSLEALTPHLPDPSPLRALSYLTSAQITLASVPITVYRDDTCNVPGYHLLVPTDAAAGLWSALTPSSSDSSFIPHPSSLSAKPSGWAAFNSARIEAGRPLFGIDFDDTVLPAETSLFNRAVSITKGCYLGQEIVARMHARNQVPKLLVGLRMQTDALPLAGSPIMDNDGNTVGVVTSSTISPILSNAPIALGHVKKPLFAIGTQLRIPAEGALHPAVIAETPFIK